MRLSVLSLLLLLSSSAWAMGNVPSIKTHSPLIGRMAPDAVLAQSAGPSTSVVSSHKGSKTILIFWATWCPSCYQELGNLNTELASIEQKGIKIILVDVGESKKAVRRYFDRRQLKLVSYVDSNSVLQDPYHLMGIPTLIFIDQTGVIRNVTHEFPSDYDQYFY